MSRKRKTLEVSYTAGFVPWTWWTRQETANLAIEEPLGFFWHLSAEKPEDDHAWRSIDEDYEPEQSPVAVRPNCHYCESTAVADIGDCYECMSCGKFLGKMP